jgi:hypothetical protein
MEKYKTGTGQTVNVHEEKDCKGAFCCIHNPSNHKMMHWPTHWRDDRKLMERMCKHGIGHPDPDDLAYKYSLGMDKSESIHGCCGCCS